MERGKFTFNDFPGTVEIETDGFFDQWCCKCGQRHIWHFHVIRGKTPDDDTIMISGFPDDTGTALRKFYERHVKSRRKARKD